MAHRIDGRKIAGDILKRVAHDVRDSGYSPGLAAVIVGDDPASHLYVQLKEKACRAAGVHFERLSFAADARASLIVRAIENLNRRQDIDGILVQLPLPGHLDEKVIIHAIDPQKDVDGFHPDNLDALRSGSPRVIPGLAGGIVTLIKATGAPIKGMNATVVANSRTFFAPLEVVLRASGLRATYAHPDDKDVDARTRDADVVIVAVGRPFFLSAPMLKPGAIVVDVGTNRVEGRTVGDLAPDALEVAGHVTPVPGGVGPMTVAMLLKNLVHLAAKRRGHG